MAEATLTLTSEGLYLVTHEGIEYEGTTNDALVGALLWLLEPDRLLLRGTDGDNLQRLQKVHASTLRLAYSITASLSPNLQSPMSHETVRALLLNACALSPITHIKRLIQKTTDALAPSSRH